MIKNIILSLLLLSSNAAYATNNNLVNYGSYTRDLNSGLDWLDLTYTQGKSYNQITSELTSSSQYAGWRYATLNEFQEIFNSRGYTFSGSSIITKTTGDILDVDLFSTLISDFGVTETAGTRSISRGILDENYLNGGQNSQIFGEIRFNNKIPTISRAVLGKVLDTDSGSILGSYLVRQAPVSTVPEPSTWALLIAGLSLILASARKKAK